MNNTFENDYPNGYKFYDWTIRPNMLHSLERYIRDGYPVGDFLHAVITNNFMQACSHADDGNKANLPAFAGYLYNVAPMGCHGSEDRYKEWCRVGGINGMARAAAQHAIDEGRTANVEPRASCDVHGCDLDSYGGCWQCEEDAMVERAAEDQS